MWGAVIGGIQALTGFSDAITSISKAISDARIATINAKTQEEKIAAEERVKALEARRDVLVAEAGVSKANVFMRTLIATPIAILFWKIFVYDKALGQWSNGRTDQLSPDLWQVVMVVIGFYFLYEGAVGITRLLKR
jgi:hypothetical protein